MTKRDRFEPTRTAHAREWNQTRIGAAAAGGLVVVAQTNGQLIGVGQRSRNGADHVIYALYIHPLIAAAGWAHS